MDVSDALHASAIVLTGLAGVGYVVAALGQWRRLSQTAAPDVDDGRWWWIAFALQSAALIASLADPAHRGFAYGALAAWSGVAAMLYAGRFVSAPARLLFALPLGAVALLVSLAGTTTLGAPPEGEDASWIGRLHGSFMAAHLAALLVAGAAGGLRLVAVRRLKSADPRATRLPALPTLERLLERSLVWGAALLIAGLATGGAAIRVSAYFRLMHPTVLLGLVGMLLLAVVLVWHRTGRLSRRALAIGALACLAISLAGTLSQVVVPHG